MQGKDLVLNVGYSHPVEIKAEEGITFAVEKIQLLKYLVFLKNKLVHCFNIRSVRPPEPIKVKVSLPR